MLPNDIYNTHANTSFQSLLEKAMNIDLVTRALRRDWTWARNRELIVDRVKLLHVYPQDLNHRLLEYDVYLYGEHGDEQQILFGELVPGGERNNYSDFIQSFYRKRMQQLRIQEWEDEVDLLQELGLVIRLAGLPNT